MKLALLEHARGRVGTIVEFAHGIFDALDVLGAYRGNAVDHARDRLSRYAGNTCHVSDAGGSMGGIVHGVSFCISVTRRIPLSG